MTRKLRYFAVNCVQLLDLSVARNFVYECPPLLCSALDGFGLFQWPSSVAITFSLLLNLKIRLGYAQWVYGSRRFSCHR